MPFFICHVCNGTYSIGEHHICKTQEKEKAADVIPLGKLIKEAMKTNEENDSDE